MKSGKGLTSGAGEAWAALSLGTLNMMNGGSFQLPSPTFGSITRGKCQSRRSGWALTRAHRAPIELVPSSFRYSFGVGRP